MIGLAGAGADDRLAIDAMLTQQYAEGYFRIYFGYVPTTETGDHVTPNGDKVSTCDEGEELGQSSPDGDTTGFALSAVPAAREAGATGLDEPIGRAVAWPTAAHIASGGWGGGVGEAPNTDSTGLIVQALADAGGAASEVDSGVACLRSAQATAADAENALGEHVGAIAYNPRGVPGREDRRDRRGRHVGPGRRTGVAGPVLRTRASTRPRPSARPHRPSSASAARASHGCPRPVRYRRHRCWSARSGTVAVPGAPRAPARRASGRVRRTTCPYVAEHGNVEEATGRTGRDTVGTIHEGRPTWDRF